MRGSYDLIWFLKSKLYVFLFVGILTISTMFYINKIRTIYVVKEEAIKDTVPKVMHLAAVSCGKVDKVTGVKEFDNPLRLSLTMLKSAALFAKADLHLHIFTEDEIKMKFSEEINSWPSIVRKRVKYTIYSADYSHLLPDKLIQEWKAWYKPCGSFRLFLPMLLENVTDAAIYSDSDVIYVKPIDELWNYFSLMNERHVAAIAPTSGRSFPNVRESKVNFIKSPIGQYQINSGIMLINFTRIRTIDWKLFHDVGDTSEIATAKYDVDLFLPYYQKYKDQAEHDQKLLNIMFHFNPDFVLRLPCSWNYKSDFCMDDTEKELCTDVEQSGAGAVHGITNVFIEKYKNIVFKKLFELFEKYKFGEDLTMRLYQPFISFTGRYSDKICAQRSSYIKYSLKRSIESVKYSESENYESPK